MSNVEQPFDALLYDLDGTLIDSAAQLAIAVNLTLAQWDKAPLPESLIRTWVGNGADKLIERAMSHCQLDMAHFSQAKGQFFAHYQSCLLVDLAMYNGVAECLAKFHAQGYVQAIVTNKPSVFVAPILAALNIDHYFALWLGGDCVSPKKPDPAPLLEACRRLNLDPTRTLMVGDSENDVIAAKAAGMKVVGLTYGYNYGRPIADSQPDWVLEHFSQLDTLFADH